MAARTKTTKQKVTKRSNRSSSGKTTKERKALGDSSLQSAVNSDMGTEVNKKRNTWVVVVFVLLLGAFLYFSKSLFVVALVNGRPISRLSLINQLERTGGQSALDALINKTLIEQAALKEGVRISDNEVQKELETVQKELESQGTTLDAALSAQGMTMVDLKENLKMKQTVEQLLKDEIKVTDEEVKSYFEENAELFGEDAKFEDLQESIKDQLENQKLGIEFQTWYDKLKSDSDIKYFVNF